jgi:Protein of unknown function (DUF4230)
MKNCIAVIALLACGILGGAFQYKQFATNKSSVQQLKLEQILSIKELHLGKHTYQDLFFIHKNNNTDKAIRAIAQVRVAITAYINLKEIKLIKEHDSIRQIILPRALLNAPHYQLENMTIRETRAFQIHIGKDLYAPVGSYLQAIIKERTGTVRNHAIANRILIQAETEGKAYIEQLLSAVGRTDIKVFFAVEAMTRSIENTTVEMEKPSIKPSNDKNLQAASVESIAFGFLRSNYT